MLVFKFGGASVNSADAVRNMASILRKYASEKLVVVISAMGKTTNALEQLVPGVCDKDRKDEILRNLKDYHFNIANSLIPCNNEPLRATLDSLFGELEARCLKTPTSYNFDYDQVVSFGELISTTIISYFLNSIGMRNNWIDVRNIIKTDANYREGHVNWNLTQKNAQCICNQFNDGASILITQGFIAGTAEGTTTTLGREGSDYSASILSYCLDAESMTIWKDVPGFLNADPKFFSNTVKIQQIPYNEAIELAYYGASVIHPKTVKPIQNKNVELHIRSFIQPDEAGSVVGPYDCIVPETPLYIFKNNQVLLSILPKDFSFIAEDNLQVIFGYFAQLGIRINVMQNSALSFTVCVDDNKILLEQLLKLLQQNFKVYYNKSLQLITIRYYTQQIVDEIVAGRPILMEQRSRSTAQIVVSDSCTCLSDLS